MDKYMLLAINEAKKAEHNGDVPVGAVIVCNNKVISRAYNKKENDNNAIAHAEILAIQKACIKLNTWHLDECTIYITMEPCMMCCGAIIQSRIKNIVYGVSNPNFGYSNKINDKNVKFVNVNSKECKEMVKEFFKTKRI